MALHAGEVNPKRVRSHETCRWLPFVFMPAANELGETEVPVQIATSLTPRQIKAFRLMDNRSHQESGWDRIFKLASVRDLWRSRHHTEWEGRYHSDDLGERFRA